MPREPVAAGTAPAAASDATAPGLFGKLPSRGDFVLRRLSAPCRMALDDWLQACLDTSRRQLGDAWLGAYLNAPVWRFVLGAGVAGPAPVAGVLMPSVDRVGRYFPLILAAQLPGCPQPQDLVRTAVPWFDALERLALTALDHGTDLTHVDAGAAGLGLPDWDPASAGAVRPARGDAGMAVFWLAADAPEPVLLYTRGLPAPQAYCSLLTLDWGAGGWRPAPDQRMPGTQVLIPWGAAQVSYAGRTHAGTRRSLNQDAFLMRGNDGLWAVADGVGGHDSGEVASRTVVEHLEHLLPPLTLDDMLDNAMHLLTEANAALCSRAAGINDTAIVASTVAVLALHGGRAGVLWSGDSRVYRWRSGELQCLTLDHAEEGGIRHAVGSGPEFVAGRATGDALPGDRYLLCSDGLTKALEDAELAAHLAAPTPEDAVAGLMDDALVAGAMDNVTAVVVLVPAAL